MPRSKKTVEDLYNEQPDNVKQLIEFIAVKAYIQGYRDANDCKPLLKDLVNNIVQETRI